ncbi:MAG: hypothetical protein L3J91_05910, partial [Thermoplasmata archaeon]|nr:hypothetical protein [Thermoplasmata archaeon]
LGSIAVALLMSVPGGTVGARPGGGHASVPSPLSIPSRGAGPWPGLQPAGASAALPSGIGPGSNGVLATYDLVHQRIDPGTFTQTFNGVGPVQAAYDPSNRLLYVAAVGTNSVDIINITTRQTVAQVAVGTEPEGIVYDPAGHEILTANYLSNNLSVISDLTNRVVAQVPISSGNSSIASGPLSL